MEIMIFAILFIASLIFGLYLIPKLQKLKLAGHMSRHDGPQSHLKKKGTPLMGGTIFILPSFIASIIYAFISSDWRIFFIAFFVLIFGAIGYLDDYVKIVRKDKKGIGAKQKMILLTIVSIVFSLLAYFLKVIDGSLVIPVLGFGYYFDIGIWILPVSVFILLASTNSANLTDGVDGLAGTVTAIVLLSFIALTSLKAEWSFLNIYTIMMFAGLTAFLYFNYNPARVFMGDSGSLAIGAFIGILVLITKTTILLPVFGFIYFIEALSVILQVMYFKKTGRRLFKMAPIHHHLELSGYSENKIVIIFSIVTMLMCTAGIYLLGIRPF